MKRIIGAAVAGILAFSGIYALAASLSVTSNTLGAGSAVVSSCTADSLVVSYGTPVYSSSIPGYTVTTVVIKDTQATPTWAACNTLAYRVTLTGVTGDEATGTLSGLVNTTNTTYTVTLPSAANASLITGVSVVIGG
ncbi:MAG: hypothetical protein ABSE52_02375 [Candidatus Dormibacteria bacterium]|jgi:hypothetical protein